MSDDLTRPTADEICVERDAESARAAQFNAALGALANPAAPSRAEPNDWPVPKLLPNGLAPVAPFDVAFLPESVAPWVADIAERMQCPVDFVAVPAIVALGATIGRRVLSSPATSYRLD